MNTGRTHLKKGCVPWNSGKTIDLGQYPNYGMTGKHQPERAKERMSLAKIGKPIHSEEHKAELRERIGEKSPNWIKDRSLLKTDRLKAYDTKYKYWMLGVKKRDGWKCRIDNCQCRGKVEAHHILPWQDYPELRYEVNNGICLCQAHHPRKRAEEKRLIPFFQGLVTVSK